ncbi:cytochrome P450 4C1-like isoform X2 [Macrobrachium nipponense]|uniref:cytochrome P450 4C1-like isoform X2 n=1 Tax=Macrobrachium nipponense TaxID=159736 RepID=UPI0030C89FBA
MLSRVKTGTRLMRRFSGVAPFSFGGPASLSDSLSDCKLFPQLHARTKRSFHPAGDKMTWLKEDVFSLVPHAVPYVFLTAIIGLVITWFIRRMQKVALIEKLPGPPGLPILGNALEVNVEPREFFQKIVEFCDFGDVMRIWLGNVPYCLISKAKPAEVILSSNKHIDKSRDYTFLHPWLGTGLLTATGPKWRSRRKLLTPAFHFKILEDFVEVFNKQSDVMVQKLEKKADGKQFDIFPYVTLCALDIICETAMGRCVHAQDNSDSDYVKALYRIGALVQQRQARPWLQPDILFKLLGYAKEHDACLKVLHDMSYSCIKERRVQFQERKLRKKKQDGGNEDDAFVGKKERLAFLDLLLEAAETDPSITDTDIREEVDTFMFEGHDTTAAAINWSLYLLGTHPEIQARVHEELDTVFGDEDRPVTMSDLRELKTTENCIKEALRLFPSVPFIGRELTEEVVIDNYRIPKGTTIMIVPFRIHRDPEQFPRPEVFDPDRFLAENCKDRHPYAYVPFSAGPRNCIGQKFALLEEKLLLCSILRKFKVESDIRREDLKLLGELILRPEDGNFVKLTPRRK